MKCENYVKMKLSPHRAGFYFIPDFYLIGVGNTSLNFNIYAITDPQLNIPTLKSLLSGSDLDKRFFSFGIKLHQGFLNGQDILCPIQNNGGIGTKTGPDKNRVTFFKGTLDLELYRTIFRDPFWCDIIQNGIKNRILDGANGYFQGKVFPDLANFRFVYLSIKDHFIYIGDGGDSGALVKIIGFYNLISHFYRHFQYHSAHRGPDHGIRCISITAGSSCFNDLISFVCRNMGLFCLIITYLGPFQLYLGDYPFMK